MKNKFLDVALIAAKEAEKIIIDYYNSDFESEFKNDNSPVTWADKEAENLIKRVISNNFPDHSFLGEETGGAETDSNYTWIIDPIDGTFNFIRKIPIFATQIALMHDNEIVAGVSNAPVMKELLFAEKGKGAFFNNSKITTSDIKSLSNSYLAFGELNHFTKKNKLNELAEISSIVQSHRGFGDFLCYHYLAQGKIDIMTEAEVKIWDIAALSIIVEEAGGCVTDIQGRPITKNTSSFLATNKHLHNKVLKLFNHR